MPKKITQRADLRKHRQRTTLDGTVYRITLTWRPRTRGWYMDLYDSQGDPIALGRRLNPGWPPLRGVVDERVPPGGFIVIGPDPYRRQDLGDDLQILYYTESELDSIPEAQSSDAPSVSVV